MKNILIGLCLTACVIFGWMLARPNPLLEEVGELRRELKMAKNEIARLKEAQTTQKVGVAATGLTPLSPTTPADDHPAPANGPGPNLRKMLEMPAMKEMLKAQNLAQIDMFYGRLFDLFELNPEEKENFKQLLAVRLGAQTELGLKLTDTSLTPEQRQQITDEFQASKAHSDEQIRTFLNFDDDYQTFEHWEDTQPERMGFEMMGGRGHFETAGEPLAADQEEQLIDIMAQVRKAPSQLPDLSQPQNLTPDSITAEQIALQMQKFDRDATLVSQRSAAILSPAQLQALKKFQEQMRAMSEMGLKMSQTILQGEP